MFFIIMFAILLMMLQTAGILYPLVIILGLITCFAAVWMLAGFCVFWLLDEFDRLFDSQSEGKTMETVTKFFTAAKAKWDALAPATKFLVVSTIAGTALVALWLN